jgi:hypothetical protein
MRTVQARTRRVEFVSVAPMGLLTLHTKVEQWPLLMRLRITGHT